MGNVHPKNRIEEGTYMEKIYRFFADTFPRLFGFVGKAIPALSGAADIVKYVILIACLALAAFAVVALVIGCFKVRFFRRLARVLLVIETLGAVGLALIALNTVKTGNIPADFVKALEVGSPDVFNLIKGIFADFGVSTVLSFIIIIILFVLIAVLLHLIIVLSRIIVKRAEKKDDEDADQPDALPVEEEIAEPTPAPAAAPAPIVATETPAPAEEPIVPADVPEQEIETVTEPETEDDALEEVAEEAPVEEAETPEEAEEEPAEDLLADEPENAPIPDYPKLDQPVFMPIPTSVSETVDFTDPKRDGYAPNPGVYCAAAEKLISDETAEDLTVVVYRKIDGKVADLPIDALNANFKPYSYVDAKILRQKGLIPETAGEVRITAHGKLEKPLMVQASEFAPGAAKMIILAGGRPIQVL